MYTDASFVNSNDLSSQLGVLIFVTNIKNTCHVPDRRNYKSQRVVPSIIGGKVCAFMDGFDCIFTISNNWKLITGTQLPVSIHTDSNQLIYAMTREKHTNQCRVIIDIMAARQAYRWSQITGTALVNGNENLADGLSNAGDNRALMQLLMTSKDPTNRFS